MRISQVGAIALVILAASLACAGADEPLVPDSQKVRINLYVADMAEIKTGDDIYLTGSGLTYTGETSIYAQANFDYQLSFDWVPEGTQFLSTTVEPRTAERAALVTYEDTLYVTRQLGGSSSTGDPPSNAFSTEEVGVYSIFGTLVGHVVITLSHAL
jgi:hypothetical protein